MRSIARHLRVSPTTVYRKFLWLAANSKSVPKIGARELYFDELETIEHTKCKPLSILLFVNERGTLIKAKVAQMPAKGRLAEFSRRKYGLRKDKRDLVLSECLSDISQSILPEIVRTDGKPSYQKAVKKYWPEINHEIHLRPEKEKLQTRLHEMRQKKKFDPLFRINHMCARLRADLRRLTRRSWCTTKKPENLQMHLDIYLKFRSN
jgi:hypothetical protein